MAKASIYSFGEDSPMKFKISDRLAELYNEAVGEWLKAQRRFNQKFGREWDPSTNPIEIKWSRKQQKAWKEFGKVFNEVVKKDGPFHENDIMDDFLVKNTIETSVTALRSWGKMISWVAIGGALYVLLKRQK